MRLALAGTILIGMALGFALPGSSDAPRPSQVSVAETRVAPAPRPGSTPAPAARGWAAETRLRRSANGHFLTTALVNGQPVEVVVDTGATTIALTEEDARRAGIAVDPATYEVIGSGAGGPLRGAPITITSVSVDGKEVRSISAAVIEGLDVSLLGQTYLSRIGSVSMSGDEMILR
jgi:aspartyl protease family protein